MYHADAEMKMGRGRLEPVEISESILKNAVSLKFFLFAPEEQRGVADIYLNSDLFLML